jgi:HK97 family phage portal protein
MRGADRRAYLSLTDVERIQLFRSGAEKSNPLYAGTIMYNSPQSQSMPRNTKAYIKEGFRGDATLYKVVRYIIENGAAIPPKLYTDKTLEKEITSHPLLEKLDNPNNEQSGVAFRESVLGHTLLAGNSFQYIIRSKKSGPPDEIWTLMPDMVHPRIAKPRGITGYDFDAFEKEQNPIDPGLIGHLKLFSADDAVWGQSPVEAGAILVDMNKSSRAWNLALLQNYARMPGAWVVPTAMAKNERDKLEEKLKEKMRGYANAGTPPVLDAGLSWQNMAVPPTDMDWLESIRRNSGDIANLYNIPPQLIGDTSASTYNNMEQAKAASYTEAIFPLLDRLYALWNNWLLPMYGIKGAYLYYDKESIEVIQEMLQAKITAKIEQATKQFLAGGIDMYTYQEMCDTKPDDNGKGIYRVGTILIHSDDLKAYAEQAMKTPAAPPFPQAEPLNVPAPTTEPNNPQPGNKPPANNQPAPTKPKPAQGTEQEPPAKTPKKSIVHLYDTKATSINAFNLDSDTKKKAYTKAMQGARDEWVETAQEQLQAYFKSEHKAVSKVLDGTDTKKSELKSAIDGQASKLKKTLSRLWQDVEEDIGSQIAQSFKDGKGKKASIPTPAMVTDTEVRYLLQMSGEKVTGIDETTLEDLQNALAEGVKAGESVAEIAARIDQLYLDDIIPNRSMTIAQTEVNSASNRAGLLAAQGSGMDLNKTWMTTSGHPRPAHADADGQEVALGDSFEVGGEELDHPGDPSGSEGNIVNCHCMLMYTSASTGQEANVDEDTMDAEEESKAINLLERKQRREDYRKFMTKALK